MMEYPLNDALVAIYFIGAIFFAMRIDLTWPW